MNELRLIVSLKAQGLDHAERLNILIDSLG